MIHVPKGTHRFKFIVDDEWKCSDDLPVSTDTDGNLVNFLEVEDETGLHQNDGLDAIAEISQGMSSSSLVNLQRTFQLILCKPPKKQESFLLSVSYQNPHRQAIHVNYQLIFRRRLVLMEHPPLPQDGKVLQTRTIKRHCFHLI